MKPGLIIYSDDEKAITDFLREMDPAMLEEIPVAASHRRPDGRSTVVQKSYRLHVAKTCKVIIYFGHGCDENDRGWASITFHGITNDLGQLACEEIVKGIVSGFTPPTPH